VCLANSQLFSKYGAVESARIIKEKGTRKSLGYGFVRYRSAADAEQAIKNLNGARIENKTLKVCPHDRYQRVARWGVALTEFCALLPTSVFVGQVALARPQGTEKNTNVYIAGLEPSVTSQGLQALFAGFGNVIEAKVLMGKGRGGTAARRRWRRGR